MQKRLMFRNLPSHVFNLIATRCTSLHRPHLNPSGPQSVRETGYDLAACFLFDRFHSSSCVTRVCKVEVCYRMSGGWVEKRKLERWLINRRATA